MFRNRQTMLKVMIWVVVMSMLLAFVAALISAVAT
jgi:hypothetical protein